jgi:hypothetical protein
MTSFDHVVLDVAANSVLWTEECAQVDVRVVVQQVRSMAVGMIDGSLIADQTNAGAANIRVTFFK